MQENIVLYFIDGMSPTATEAEEAGRLRAKIRNAKLAADGPVEHCSAVAGPAIPESYAGMPIVEREKTEDPSSAVAGPATTLYEMTVKQLRAYAGEKGIPLPAHVNTKEEITAHIEQYQG